MTSEKLPETQPEHSTFDYFAKTICRQNTGRHFLDSGDYYGRQYDLVAAQEKETPALKIQPEGSYLDRDLMTHEQWERGDANSPHSNETQRFFREYQPGDVCSAMATISLPHFLHVMLDSGTDSWAERLQKAFYKWANLARNYREPWEDNLERFFKRLEAHGWNVKREDGGYTYNSDNDFDQDFVYSLVELESPDHSQEDLIIIRSHNGCDARGGFSSPFFFTWTSPYAKDYFWNWRVEFSFGFNAHEIDAEAWQKNQLELADIDQSVNEWITRENRGSEYFSADELTDYQISTNSRKGLNLRFVYVDKNTAQAQVELPWRKGTWIDIYPYNPVEGY